MQVVPGAVWVVSTSLRILDLGNNTLRMFPPAVAGLMNLQASHLPPFTGFHSSLSSCPKGPSLCTPMIFTCPYQSDLIGCTAGLLPVVDPQVQVHEACSSSFSLSVYDLYFLA